MVLSQLAIIAFTLTETICTGWISCRPTTDSITQFQCFTSVAQYPTTGANCSVFKSLVVALVLSRLD